MGFFSKIFGGILNGYASRNLEKKMKNDPKLKKHVDAMGSHARKALELMNVK